MADKKNIGIWVNKKKIAAIGIKVSRWIAFHGYSINISNNLKSYLKISPCGLDNKKVTSVIEQKGKILNEVENNLIRIFLNNLNKI